MQAQSTRPVKTFTIGFNEAGYNEAVHAKAVASHLGTDHTEMYVSAQEALDVIPALPRMYCEPFADSSQIPTFLVSRLARQTVTVSLSGDAGDELFGGYNRYTYTQRIHEKLDSIPFFLRNATSGLIRQFDPITLNRLLSFSKYKNIGEKLHKLADVINVSDPMLLYRSLISHFDRPSELVLQSIEPPTLLTGIERGYETLPLSTIERMMMLDTVTYLPDDILAKVDRSAMSVSLETRVPFLDHRVFEFAWSIPMSYKLQGNSGKKILKSLLYRYVPEKYFNRPKMGFGIPRAEWLRTGMKEMVIDTLTDTTASQRGWFNSVEVKRVIDIHIAGEDKDNLLWPMFMLELWARTWLD
jgi:asparagine synthase (glutamine-hydrolysing)